MRAYFLKCVQNHNQKNVYIIPTLDQVIWLLPEMCENVDEKDLQRKEKK
jgi:hypothetical protein